jgi:hypothetical protein
MISCCACLPDRVMDIAHDQRADVRIDVIRKDEQQVVVAVWPSESLGA